MKLNELEDAATTRDVVCLKSEDLLTLCTLVREMGDALLWVNSRFSDVSAKAMMYDPLAKYKEVCK